MESSQSDCCPWLYCICMSCKPARWICHHGKIANIFVHEIDDYVFKKRPKMTPLFRMFCKKNLSRCIDLWLTVLLQYALREMSVLYFTPFLWLLYFIRNILLPFIYPVSNARSSSMEAELTKSSPFTSIEISLCTIGSSFLQNNSKMAVIRKKDASTVCCVHPLYTRLKCP